MIRARASSILVAFLLMCHPATFASQAPQAAPIGTLNAAGDVFLNNAPVSGQATVYAGETVRTGSDGAGQVAIPGKGSLSLNPQSQISFPAAARYLAVLEQGTVGLRSLEGAANMQVRIRDFIVLPDPEHESAAQVEISADGSVRITCVAGAIGVTQFEGPAAVFLNPGEMAIVTPNGILLRNPAAEETPVSTAPPTPGARRSRKGLFLLLGVAGGGAAGAAAALSGHNVNHPSMSNYVP